MKKTLKFFSLATLILAVATLTGCSKEEEQAAEPAVVKICTTTVSIEGNEASKALTEAGVKTFEAGEQIAVVYENTSGTLVKEEIPLTAGDISNAGKNATISLEMTNPQASGTLRIIYPAAMAGTDDVDYSKLYTQNGTLDQISSQFDLGLYDGNLTAGAELPASPELTNPLTICKLTLKNEAGSSTLTDITALYIGDGENFYMVTPASATNDPLWVAMKPVSSSQWITFHATDGTHKYEKEVTGKTLLAANMYHLGIKCTQLQDGALFGTFSMAMGVPKHFSQGNLQATTTDLGAHWSWAFAMNQYDHIGNATANNALTGDHTVSANGTVDLFCWSTANTYFGISNSQDIYDYHGVFVDWGTNAISNGGNVANVYSTPMYSDWEILFYERTSANSKYGNATVCGVMGLVVLPDHWTLPNGCSFNPGLGNWTSVTNIFDAAHWAKMEAAGAVFLPCADDRLGPDVSNYGDFGVYWSSTEYDDDYAYVFSFDDGPIAGSSGLFLGDLVRVNGNAVRLVCE